MPPVGRAGPPAAVEWTVSPWREDPARAAVAVISALLLWLLVTWMLAGERLLSTLLGVAVVVVLAPGMTAMQCRVDGDGVARRVLFAWDRRAWPDIRRARVSDTGLFVSPLAHPGRLDRFRGLFLPVPHRSGGAAQLLDALRQELVRHGL
jgi:hypothetical protein